MAHNFFMNLEVLALEIIDEHIEKMTESNSRDAEYADPEAFRNNLKNGWIVVVALNGYVESVLNTILRECILCRDEKLMKLNFEEKIRMIYMCYKTDISSLRKESCWEAYKKVNRIRNGLIHYKYNYMGISGGIPSTLGPPLGDVGVIFTNIEMRKIKEGILKFCEKVVEDLNLKMNPDVELFDTDGSAEHPAYIYDDKRYRE